MLSAEILGRQAHPAQPAAPGAVLASDCRALITAHIQIEQSGRLLAVALIGAASSNWGAHGLASP